MSEVIEEQKKDMKKDVDHDIDAELIAYEKLLNDKKAQSLFKRIFNEDQAVNGIAYICVVAVFSYIFSVTFFSTGIGEDHLRFVDQSLGNLYGILNTIIGFYCGNVYAKSKNQLDNLNNKNK